MKMVGFNLFAGPKKHVADIEVWEENWQSVLFFSRLGTRWLYLGGGMGGAAATGLRWEAIYPLMDRLRLSAKKWNALLDDLETMEDEALKVMRESSAS